MIKIRYHHRPHQRGELGSGTRQAGGGELDAAHILYGLLYGLELGIAGKPQQMANLMTLNQNGQAITLSSDLAEKGFAILTG